MDMQKERNWLKDLWEAAQFAALRMRMITGAHGLTPWFPAFPSKEAAAPKKILWVKLSPLQKHLHSRAKTTVPPPKGSCDL